MDEELKAEFDSLRQEINTGFEHVNVRIDLTQKHIYERLDEIQKENNEWHVKTFRLQQGMEARVSALEDRVASLEKGY